MANRIKEDEKNEKTIRGLLKLPANRRCMNCNSLGPQYVCTNFWTFICTNCSGLHREFTHRVKSISMAKFTSQEVIALQEGGNERAKEIYFKEWDPQRHSVPDSSNLDRLRDFIKHVYVDRRYTGERSIDRPPRVKGDREDFNENRRPDSYQGGSRSPPYDDAYERRYSERPGSGGRNDDRNLRYGYEERRSPGYDQGDYKRSPGNIEVVDDRRRDDKFGNGSQNRRFEDRRFPDGVPKPEGRSPNHQKDFNMSSPPMVRPVRDILGDNIPPLRVGDPPKSNGSRVPDSSEQTRRTASSSSLGSSDGNSVEMKTVSSGSLGSLIDFNADPEPPIAAAPHQSAPQQITSPPANSGDWASFDMSAQPKAPQAASNTTTLESALAQLSVPGSAPAGNISALPVAGVDSFPKTNDGGQWPTMQQNQPSLFLAANGRSTNPPFGAPVVGALNNQSWGSSLAPNMQGAITAPTGQPSQGVAKPHQEMNAGVISQPPGEVKPAGRKELPQDLFTAIYQSAPASVLGWQTVPHPGMGFGMQYPTAARMPTFPQSSQSTNPFDHVNEPTVAHASSFPSMTSLQGALPNMTVASGLIRSSSFGAPSPRWVPQQQPSYSSAVPPSPYMVQQAPNNMPQQAPSNMFPMVQQGIGGFSSEGAAFGYSGMDQHSAARYSQPGTPNSFAPVGGNPFG